MQTPQYSYSQVSIQIVAPSEAVTMILEPRTEYEHLDLLEFRGHISPLLISVLLILINEWR